MIEAKKIRMIKQYSQNFDKQTSLFAFFFNHFTKEGDLILDPFCGSGTTLVECTHMGIPAIGLDINPLAVYITNAKLGALSIPYSKLQLALEKLLLDYKNYRKSHISNILSEREIYLLKWFPEEIYVDIELFKKLCIEMDEDIRSIFLIILSNHLRDYSNQEPADLRIRKRKSPFPTKSLIVAFEESANQFIRNLKGTQEVLGVLPQICKAYNLDSRSSKDIDSIEVDRFNGVITSPPYATALPYIDTQRLSLVWLDFCEAKKINHMEGTLVGSREFNEVNKKEWLQKMIANEDNIPQNIHQLCLELQNAIGDNDGFRRKVVPTLLYRYSSDMQKMFGLVIGRVAQGAKYSLIVGHNHTVLGGKRFDIDTPKLLVELAQNVGWILAESIELQTYQRYGLHHKNAIGKETCIILGKP